MNLENKIVLTGIKPTGTLHVGNYVGAMVPSIDLGNQVDQNKHFMFIADYHALNQEKDGSNIKQWTKEIASAYLACGLNPEHSVFYRQSDVPEIFELQVLLSAYTPKGWMNKAHAYKASVDKNNEKGHHPDDGVNMGLYTYPTLMASDILMFQSDIVPVGKDQVQHVEITRDIASSINHVYKDKVFKTPDYFLKEDAATLPGTDGRKMSKSYNNVIPLFKTDKEIKKAIMSIATDSRPIEEPKDPEGILVYQIAKTIMTPERLEEMATGLKEGKLGYGHIKKMLLEDYLALISDMREKYEYYISHEEELEAILQKGAEKAREIARRNLAEIKEKIFG
ncbi:MAG: tryptophan--tRNA ligase [Alphaproteobacteria bacterium]|jgi:tryptophanyl-tRNA synthetase|nr:tryptophan--tRNA ligase [Alphaproteobacteria bacterium]